jgi:predicted RNA methylase
MRNSTVNGRTELAVIAPSLITEQPSVELSLGLSRQRNLGQYMTPAAVADQMCEQIHRPIEDWVALDPACGDGNLLLAAARRMRDAGVSDIPSKLIGTDVDPSMVAQAKLRLSSFLGCSVEVLNISQADFLAAQDSLFSDGIGRWKFNTVISNPPYGRNREYRFFEEAARISQDQTELVFLVPLAFLDRVNGTVCIPLKGRPLGVTTGHAIVRFVKGDHYTVSRIKVAQDNLTRFTVLSGVKLYELGAGDPPQDKTIFHRRPYSSAVPRDGWLPCLRTGDIHPYSITLGRLYVHYGPHLAHPKSIDRFSGPRLFVRRVPIWENRRLGAVYCDDPILCAGDVLVIKHETDDPGLLKGLCVFLNSFEAARCLLFNRPSLGHRMSFPKISAKDLNRLLDEQGPTEASFRALADSYGQ